VSQVASATGTALTPSTLIPIAQVRSRYGGVSDMWVERRLKGDLGFPKPVYISKRRYWRLDDLITWERSLARSAVSS
jgi:hypothetical protein